MYGIAIALGVIAAIVLASRRLERRGHDPKLMERAGIWAVAMGIVGARLGYVITHPSARQSLVDAIRVWDGGLAFFGGLTGGAIAMIVVMRRAGVPISHVADAVAPAIPLAQAIGRWGNYFNQELYGKPTDLPWALEITVENRVTGYRQFETFHPTFLYESLLNLVVVGIILWVDKRFRPPAGSLFGVYLILYGLVRFGMEFLRIDTEYRLAGLSRNGWISLLAVVLGVAWVEFFRRRTRTAATV
jgi:prolipoprotein diacylglyceryl transferase